MQRLLAWALWVLVPLSAAADGKVFPTVLAAEVKIPDQRALIHFTNGVERLVIETRFTGSGTNFAWVVPLPNQPVVEEASTGLFPTLQYLFRPEIVHRVPRYYLAFLAVLGIGYVKSRGANGGENLLVGGNIREEDSPGNFVLRENGDELEFVAYDSQGAEHVLQWSRPLKRRP